MNIAAKYVEKEDLLLPENINSIHYYNSALIGACQEEFTLMKTLAKRIDGIDNMSPIFYFPIKDSVARKMSYAYIIPEMRETYKFGHGYNCIFDRRIIRGNYEHLHIYFRKQEILAVHCNDVERGKYFGVSLPRYLSNRQGDEWEFKRNNKVESVDMDLKLGIYDIRFELFFNTIFDFYITSGMKW
ncbi:MAG: hypothetical protein IJX20_00870 [Alphaproteobacteria bacterium]|nr:hypothetical protein [Alphaproteobacteria bacterium]